jgi:hypothetical protein
MKILGYAATIDRQVRSRLRSPAFWVGASAPVVLIGILLAAAGHATDSPAVTMFLAVLSGLWIGGSGSVREIVDERRLVQRDPHVSLLAYAAAKLLFAAAMAGFQSAVLTGAVGLSGCIHLPAPIVWIILWLTTVCGAFMALVLSALCDEAATALAWFPLLLVPQVVFGGFLFPYHSTQPFALDPRSRQVVVTPGVLAPQAVDSLPLQAAGAFTVSRWALEAYAAFVYARDLGDRNAFDEAVKVNAFVPVTFGDDVAYPLARHLAARSRGESPPPPELTGGGIFYLLLLLVFAGAEAAALVLILPLRDPRRAPA